MSMTENTQPTKAELAEEARYNEANEGSMTDQEQISEESRRLVQNSVAYVFNSTMYLYSLLREKSYESSDIAKYGFDTLESIAKKSQPYAQTLYNASQPVVESVDNNLDKVVNKLHDIKKKADETKQTAKENLFSSEKALLPANWFTNVDGLLKPHIDIAESLTLFSNIVSNAYVQLHEKAVQAANVASNATQKISKPILVDYKDFLESVKLRLGRVWSSPIAVATSAAFSHLQASFQKLSTSQPVEDVKALTTAVEKRLREYEESIVKNVTTAFKTRLTSPATALYNSALEGYVSLTKKASDVASSAHSQFSNRPSLTEFLSIMKTKLGESYTLLEAPLTAFHEKLSTVRDIELEKATTLASSFRINETGKLCLYDVYFASRSAYDSLSSYLNQTYSNILTKTANNLDYYVLNEKEEQCSTDMKDEEKDTTDKKIPEDATVQSLSQLSSHITKRLRNKLSKRIAPIRSYSANQFTNLKTYTNEKVRQAAGEDIIRRAEAGIVQVENLARSVHEKTLKDLHSAQTSVNDKVQSAYEHFDTRVKKVKDALKDLVDYFESTRAVGKAKDVAQQYKPSVNDLKERVERAGHATQELLQASTHYALRRELQAIPTDALDFLAKGIPKIVQIEREASKSSDSSLSDEASDDKQVNVLVNDLENSAVSAGVVRVHGLIEALKDVLFWSIHASPQPQPTTVAKPANAKDTTESTETTSKTNTTQQVAQPVLSTSSSSSSASDLNVQVDTLLEVVESEIQRALESSSESDDDVII